MFETAKKSSTNGSNTSDGTTYNGPAPTPVQPGRKVNGTSYDVCIKVKQDDGTEKTKRIGTLFIRSSGTGGVIFVTDPGDGTKHEMAIFPRKPKG